MFFFLSFLRGITGTDICIRDCMKSFHIGRFSVAKKLCLDTCQKQGKAKVSLCVQ